MFPELQLVKTKLTEEIKRCPGLNTIIITDDTFLVEQLNLNQSVLTMIAKRAVLEIATLQTLSHSPVIFQMPEFVDIKFEIFSNHIRNTLDGICFQAGLRMIQSLVNNQDIDPDSVLPEYVGALLKGFCISLYRAIREQLFTPIQINFTEFSAQISDYNNKRCACRFYVEYINSMRG